MKTVVLAGSGHAHLEVIKAFSKEEIAAHRFLLISPRRQTYYSGLIPRLITGEIDVSKLTINSADFAEAKGFYFLQDSIQAINHAENTVTLASGKMERFDLLSMNVGGTPKKIPTESPFNTIYLRPFDDFMPRWREVQRICSACVSPRFVVVGGGAAAVEVATALRIRLNRNQARKSEVHLVTKGPRLCEGYTEQISDSIQRSLLDFSIQVHLNEAVGEILSKHIKLSSGEKLEFDSIFIVTPTEPSEITSAKIDSTLRISSNIFAVGDGATMLGHPELPRSGVIAVHQGRHLAQSIRNILSHQSPKDFAIRSKQLNILISGENSARLVWGNFSFEGRLPLQIKNWIDERYMRKFD
ncbi:MAG: NAD(P)/FAD-dependent oxidoreductase [Pseudobdellovibrionaceae bacterium]